jgi:glutathione S-transferase
MGRYISIAEARQARGLRLVCLRGVPSPWTEAARSIFHVKGLSCQYAARGADEPEDAVALWAGDSSVPVVAWQQEKLRTGWAEILLLGERLAAEPRLIPLQADQRVLLFGLGHEMCGEMGLGWCLRLLLLQRTLGHEAAESPMPVEQAARLAGKYGLIPAHVRQAKPRVLEILALLDDRLKQSPFLMGEALTAADLWWAAFANLIEPLPQDMMPLAEPVRAMLQQHDGDITGAFTGRLSDHRRRIYQDWLEVPVPL